MRERAVRSMGVGDWIWAVDTMLCTVGSGQVCDASVVDGAVTDLVKGVYFRLAIFVAHKFIDQKVASTRRISAKFSGWCYLLLKKTHGKSIWTFMEYTEMK